jgi:hypothetical protein
MLQSGDIAVWRREGVTVSRGFLTGNSQCFFLFARAFASAQRAAIHVRTHAFWSVRRDLDAHSHLRKGWGMASASKLWLDDKLGFERREHSEVTKLRDDLHDERRGRLAPRIYRQMSGLGIERLSHGE